MRFLTLLAMLVLGACQTQPLVPSPSPTVDLGLAPALTAPPMPPSVEVLQATRPVPAVPKTVERCTVRPGLRVPRTRVTPVSCAPRIDLPCFGGT